MFSQVPSNEGRCFFFLFLIGDRANSIAPKGGWGTQLANDSWIWSLRSVSVRASEWLHEERGIVAQDAALRVAPAHAATQKPRAGQSPVELAE